MTKVALQPDAALQSRRALKMKKSVMWWERERERTSNLRIIGIQMPSQVSEAEGELGERVALVWIHYELVHADAPCNHLRQMERRTERGPSNPAGLSGKMYGCPHPPGTHSQHLFRSFSLQQSLSLWISIFLSVSFPLSPSPHFSRLLPRCNCFPSPTWPAPGGVPMFHSIPSNDARAEGTCISLCSLKSYQPTQPPTTAHSNLCTPIFKEIALFRRALSAARPTEMLFLDYNRCMNHSAS